ncbi:VOC family protein [Thalassotalea sp. Y01]|uniref:VOC family protein n=1 Tax=Thalassotalea sp. Y01 TaxID=2729613 RepID=UPI00145F6694|nr:VOC family protein [Thalassotalea sp. Y01]NMP17897.1 VOC family protein [Thalassotalea sp. Y01]
MVAETINYIELPTTDIRKVKQFYSQAFQWQFTDYGPDYTAFNDGSFNGGFYLHDKTASYQQGAPLVVLYSSHLEESLAKVINHGGVIVKPIFSFPGGRRFHFTDPGGNELAIWSDS